MPIIHTNLVKKRKYSSSTPDHCPLYIEDVSKVGENNNEHEQIPALHPEPLDDEQKLSFYGSYTSPNSLHPLILKQ